MKQIPKTTLERVLTLDRKTADQEARTVSAALSSETPVERPFGIEVLEHSAAAINFERAADGLPLLWAHNHEQPIGRVEDIRLDADKVLRGNLRFSKNARAEEIWQDVADGFLRDLSIGYRIDEWREEDDDVVRVTRFTPLEASVVTVPADNRAGINRSIQEVEKMTDEVKTDAAPEPEVRKQPEVKSELKLFTLEKERERKEGARIEAARRADIRDLFSRYVDKYGDVFADLQRACEDSPEISVAKAKEAILEAVADGYVSVDVSARQDAGSHFSGTVDLGRKPRISAGTDQADKFQRAMEISLRIQAGHKVDEDERRECRETEWYSMSVSDMARHYLRIHGERAVGEKHQIIGKAMQHRAPSHSTGHFASVLENVANKAMVAGFMDADETWNRWANIRSIPDFKATSLLNMSLFTDLDTVYEGTEYEYGDMSDLKETIQLLTYGKLFGITRQALANDDVNALGSVPMAMGAAANRKVGDLVYAVLSTGTTVTMLQDSTAIFDAATHANYVTAGAAPSVTTLDAGRTAMATQTDPQGKTIGLRPRHLIVPIALQTTAEVLMAAQYDPAGTAGTLPPNPFQNAMAVTADHRLDTYNSSGWFLAAATNQVVVGFLNGQQTPYMESKDGWSIDGIEYKVRIDAAATAEDYRGLYYNDGVT